MLYRSLCRIAAGLVIVAGATGVAGTTGAEAQVRPSSAELLPGWQEADGRHVVAISIDLAPGWKTYWRAPGDGGIPPQLDWTGSENVAAIDLHWPVPGVYDSYGMRTVGYERRLVLPISVTPEQAEAPVDLSLALSYGVCADICVPVGARLDLQVSGSVDNPDPAIAAALADQAVPAHAAGVTAGACRLSPDGETYTLDTDFTFGTEPTGPITVLAEAPTLVDLWISPASVEQTGDLVSASMTLDWFGEGPFALDRASLRFTLLNDGGAIDVQGCAVTG
ncbi:MAG: protein-disulfide reductase DsbD domain-containing protein [Pseudomonadota bacterium]